MKSGCHEQCYSKDAFRVDRNGRSWNLYWSKKGFAGEFIQHLPALIEAWRKKHGNQSRLKVVLFARVSSGPQKKKGNLRHQLAKLRADVAALGCDVILKIREVSNGSIWTDRPRFERAIECARRQGAVLVAAYRDRFLRHAFYNGTKKSDFPTVLEYFDFRKATTGIAVATVLHPDASNARSEQTTSGQQAKGTPIGRPQRKYHGPGSSSRRKVVWLPFAQTCLAEGWSLNRLHRHFRGLAERRGGSGFPAPSLSTLSRWKALNSPIPFSICAAGIENACYEGKRSF